MIRWLCIAALSLGGCAGGVRDAPDAEDSATTELKPGMNVADAIPEFPAGSTMAEIQRLLLDSQKQDPSDRAAKVNYANCPLLHQFTLARDGSLVVCVTGRLRVYSEQYFIFRDGLLQKVVTPPPERRHIDGPVDPEALAERVLNLPALMHEEIVAVVNEDLRVMAETERMKEPFLPLLLFPDPDEDDRPKPKAGHAILQWKLGESPGQFDAIYGPPMRIVNGEGGRRTRISVAGDQCGGHLAATFQDGKLVSLFSHDFFDPRHWLDQLSEPYRPGSEYEVLKAPTKDK